MAINKQPIVDTVRLVHFVQLLPTMAIKILLSRASVLLWWHCVKAFSRPDGISKTAFSRPIGKWMNQVLGPFRFCLGLWFSSRFARKIKLFEFSRQKYVKKAFLMSQACFSYHYFDRDMLCNRGPRIDFVVLKHIFAFNCCFGR